MKILLVHNNKKISGGGDLFVHEIDRLLSSNGHKTLLFSSEDCTDKSFKNLNDYNKSNTNNAGILQKIKGVQPYIYNFNVKKKFKETATAFQPDIIHFFTVYGRLTVSVLDAARELNVKTIMSCNDYKHICGNYKLFHHGKICTDCKEKPILSPLINKCAHNSIPLSFITTIESAVHVTRDVWRRNIDCFLFSSKYMADITSDFWNNNHYEFDFLPNPFNLELNYCDVTPGSGFLYFGRISEEKGVEKFLSVAKHFPESIFTVVGDGSLLNVMRERYSNVPNIIFSGALWGSELKQAIKNSKAIVVPSVWPENYPYVVLQAFSSGKPVIGSRRGGIPELIGDNGSRGILFDPDLKDDIIQAIEFMNSKSDYDLIKMGKSAQDFVEMEFSDKKIYSKLIKIYKKVLL
jgi:glycosyltransferase involved in cell wall biosynthesis